MGHKSQTVKARYTKLSEFFCLPISVILRHFRAKSDVWGGHRRLWKTDGSRRKCLKIWFWAKTPLKINFWVLKPKNELFLWKNTTFLFSKLLSRSHFKFWLFLKVSKILSKLHFVKSRYLDPHTSDLALKYLILTGIAQGKFPESFVHVTITV